MPEKTICKEDSRKQAEKETGEESAAEKNKTDERGIWSHDQQSKSYYYDDSYGYEVYIPEEDDEAENH